MGIAIKKIHEDAKVDIINNSIKLYALSVKYTGDDVVYIEYDTGVIVKIPENHIGMVTVDKNIINKELIPLTTPILIYPNSNQTIKMQFVVDISNFWDADSGDTSFQIDLEQGKFNYFQEAGDEYHQRILQAYIYSLGEIIGTLVILPVPTIDVLIEN